jgi:hypothetical protein
MYNVTVELYFTEIVFRKRYLFVKLPLIFLITAANLADRRKTKIAHCECAVCVVMYTVQLVSYMLCLQCKKDEHCARVCSVCHGWSV